MPPRKTTTTTKPVPSEPVPTEQPSTGTVEEARLTPGAQAARDRVPLQEALDNRNRQDSPLTRQEQAEFICDYRRENVRMYLGFLGDLAEGYNDFWLSRMETDLRVIAREFGWR